MQALLCTLFGKHDDYLTGLRSKNLKLFQTKCKRCRKLLVRHYEIPGACAPWDSEWAHLLSTGSWEYATEELKEQGPCA